MGDDRPQPPCAAVAGPLLLAAVAGALAGAALPPLGFPPLLWPALALLWGWAGEPPVGADQPVLKRLAGATGLVWGLAAVLVSHRWLIWLHPLDWIGVPGPLSLPLCLLLWLACGLAGGVLVQGWLALVRRCDARLGSTAVAAACLWGLAEVLLARGPLFWIGLGGSALPGDRALAGVAALGGAGLLAALQLLVGWCLWRLVMAVGRRRRWLLLTLLVVAGGHLLGLAGLAVGREPPAGDAAVGGVVAGPGSGVPLERLLVLQPAIPTRVKFEADQQQRLLSQLAAAERREALLPPAERVQGLLLPEGALALDQPLPVPAPVEVLSGGFRRQGEELRSSLLRFAAGSIQPGGGIDKHRVVPLGEWVPLASLWRWGGLSAVGGIGPGAPSRLLARPAGPVGVAICYEIADGAALARASREGARWLLASANLDPYPLLLQQQFLALARLRAIETGRWLVSVANTGPSGVVDAGGRLRGQLPAGKASLGRFSLEPRTALTPYVRWGEGPLLALLLVAAGLRLGGLRSRRPPGRPR